MKHLTYKLLAALVLATVLTNIPSSAKRMVTDKMYVFGFAASFNDTIVYFTDVQEVDSPWIETKYNFLLGRELYSMQLRDFLRNNKQLPFRTCVVIYDKNRTKAEKKYVKMKRHYGQMKDDGHPLYDIRFLEEGEFRFKSVDMSESEMTEEEDSSQPAKKEKKKSKRKKGEE
jgi:hypothetical protein